jgi:hypothetical protein
VGGGGMILTGQKECFDYSTFGKSEHGRRVLILSFPHLLLPSILFVSHFPFLSLSSVMLSFSSIN